MGITSLAPVYELACPQHLTARFFLLFSQASLTTLDAHPALSAINKRMTIH
jgi:hypothetical protein